MKLRILVGILLTVGASSLQAQQNPASQQARELTIVARNITAADEAAAGKQRADAGKAAFPGDTVEYRLTFTNTKTIALKDVVFQDPIPAGLTYVVNSATASRSGVQIEYSLDGGKTWAETPVVNAMDAQGRPIKRPAPAQAYTNIRWSVAGMLGVGERVDASFRTRVNGPEAPKQNTAAPKVVPKKPGKPARN